jgi:hypothetical protein
MNDKLYEEAVKDAKAVRQQALANAKNVLESAFVEQKSSMDITIKLPCQDGLSGEEIDEIIEELESEEIDEIIEELESEVDEPPKDKKPSFFHNLMLSIYRKKPNPLRCRFQKLAGITKIEPKAKLTIGNNTFDLQEIPPWYDVIRYKLCGFKFEIPSKCYEKS